MNDHYAAFDIDLSDVSPLGRYMKRTIDVAKQLYSLTASNPSFSGHPVFLDLGGGFGASSVAMALNGFDSVVVEKRDYASSFLKDNALLSRLGKDNGLSDFFGHLTFFKPM